MKKALGMLVILALVAGGTAVFNSRFLSAENLGNVGRLIGLHGVLALAAAVVILAGGIDLSLGSVVAFAGLVFVLVQKSASGGTPLAFVAALGSGAAIGTAQGLLIATLRLPPFVVTLCGLLVVRGGARYLTEDQSEGFGADGGTLRELVDGATFAIPNTLLLLGGLSALLAVLLHLSVFGRHLFAMGSNEVATNLAGIPVARNKVIVYGVSGLLAAFAGILFVAYTNTLQPASAGQGYELLAIAAAVLGGASLRGGSGTVLGVLVGTALIRVLMNATTLLSVPTYLDQTVVGTAILLGVILDELRRRRR